MRISFWGVRGSTAVSGAQYARYGGATSCITLGRDGSLPTMVLDAGTGLMNLARSLGAQPFAGTVLLTHLHWDHMQGIPFFFAADREDAAVQVAVPGPDDGQSAVDLLGRIMNPPFFPIAPQQLRGDWRFDLVESGAHTYGPWIVTSLDIPHGGGRTFGFRISDGFTSVAYLPDHRPTALGPGDDGFGELHPAALELAADVDVLIHGAPYTGAELERADEYGHSTIPYALNLAERCGVKRLVLTHHAPLRTDDELDHLATLLRPMAMPVSFAYEGMILDVA